MWATMGSGGILGPDPAAELNAPIERPTSSRDGPVSATVQVPVTKFAADLEHFPRPMKIICCRFQ